MQQLN